MVDPSLTILVIGRISSNKENPALREVKWWIGDGFHIPFHHKNWFHCPSLKLEDPRLTIGTVRDLINHNTSSWKSDLVKSELPMSFSALGP